MKQSVVIANQEYVYTRTEIRFFGGPRDGELIACRLDAVNITDADGILWQTNGGKPGEHYFTLSEYGSQFLVSRLWNHLAAILVIGALPKSHCYEVIARWIRKDALCLNLAYRGPDDCLAE